MTQPYGQRLVDALTSSERADLARICAADEFVFAVAYSAAVLARVDNRRLRAKFRQNRSDSRDLLERAHELRRALGAVAPAPGAPDVNDALSVALTAAMLAWQSAAEAPLRKHDFRKLLAAELTRVLCEQFALPFTAQMSGHCDTPSAAERILQTLLRLPDTQRVDGLIGRLMPTKSTQMAD